MNGCGVCGIPADAGWFDNSRVEEAPALGQQVEVASFRMPNQYCGMLVYFTQYAEPAEIYRPLVETPGYRWAVIVNGQPCAPYNGFERIINPWGSNGFPTALRVPEGALVSLVVQNVSGSGLTRVGGRLMGRYWYNDAYGGQRDVERVTTWLRAAGLQPVEAGSRR